MPQFSGLTIADLLDQGYGVAIFRTPTPRIVQPSEIARPRRRIYLHAPNEGSDRHMAWIKIKDAGRPLHIKEIVPNDKQKQSSLNGSMRKAALAGQYFKNAGPRTWDILQDHEP
jgi:hypothetical protein